MHLNVSAEAVDGGVPAQVKAVEDQGSYRIVHVTLAGKSLRAKLPEGGRIPHDSVWLTFPLEWTRLFADGRLVK